MDIIDKLISAEFVDLGFAAWESGKGLQINNLHLLDNEAPGVYIMHHAGLIQKVGKSSASLRRRLAGYRRFDRDALACREIGKDKSSQKQRRAMERLALPGLSVLALQVEVTTKYIAGLGIDVKVVSFDPHDFEKKLIYMLKADHPLEFGK